MPQSSFAPFVLVPYHTHVVAMRFEDGMGIMRKAAYVAILLLVLVLVAQAPAIVGNVVQGNEDKPAPVPEFSRLEQLVGKRLGTVLGTTYDADVIALQPDASDFSYFGDTAEMVAALKYRRIDAFCEDEPVARIAVERNDGLAIMPEGAGLDANAVAFPKGSMLVGPVSELVERFVQDGTMQELEHEWCDYENADRQVPTQDWAGSAGTILCAVDDANEPVSYRDGSGKLVGLEIELALLIARELDMRLEFVPMSFDAVMTSLSTNDVDMAIAGISITDERAKRFELTPAYRSANVTLVARNTVTTPTGLARGLADRMRKTFFTEGYGVMFVEGVLLTIGISLASVLLGVVLGHVSAVLILILPQLSGLKGMPLRDVLWKGPLAVLRLVLLASEKFMGEVPVVIVLLVLRYLVFDFMAVSGTYVAVLGLSLSLASTVSSTVRGGVASVGRKAWELSFAMGYTVPKALRRVIFPLAYVDYASKLNDALIQLVFDTSVVGFVTVYDMTRVADLIRTRTADALPPLIATMTAYLALSHLLARLLDLIANKATTPRLLPKAKAGQAAAR